MSPGKLNPPIGKTDSPEANASGQTSEPADIPLFSSWLERIAHELRGGDLGKAVKQTQVWLGSVTNGPIGPIGESMCPDVREAAITTITRYAFHHDSEHVLEMIGLHRNHTSITDAMVCAAIIAILPLLSDERINFLMRDIAEILVNGELENEPKGAQ